MKRRLKVLAALNELCGRIPKELDEYASCGFTAEQVAEHAGLCRSNVSGDLNQLNREGATVKTMGRPTYYLAVSWVERTFPHLGKAIPLVIRHYRDLQEAKPEKDIEAVREDSEPVFNQLVGSDGSLQGAIEQARSAVLYPPKGLDTIIAGPTGVGKTLFAEYMFRFAQMEGRIRPGSQMVVFNCADYAHNPQLLLSQLFGYAKGSFTGAEREKAGLVEKADGGMLFLDEIHRMPPEGQEMLFYLLDKGQFQRMGEVDRKRQVTLMLIGATTEEPDSVLLKTFLRRIPMVIYLPELSARPLYERFLLIKYLLAQEAAHIHADIVVDREALLALLLYTCSGNIGQLRNDLQIVCAKSFLNYIRQKNNIHIDYDALHPKIKLALPEDNDRRREAARMVSHIGQLVITASPGMEADGRQEGFLPVDFYQQLANRVQFLERQGLADCEVIKFIEVDIDQYFRQIYPKAEMQEPLRLPNLPPAFMAAMDRAREVAAEMMGKTLSDRLYCALAVHMASSVERIASGQVIFNPKLNFIDSAYPVEMQVAEKMAEIIGAYAGVEIPREEIGFIALMLAKLEDSALQEDGKVGVMVIAHGKSTASSLVDFANKLLGVTMARAIDMSMEVSTEDIIPQAVAMAREIDEGKGIVLLVDMGSLSSIGTAITGQTGIRVKTVDMVTTVMVLHTLHRVILSQNGLDEVYRAAWDARHAWGLQ